MENYRIVAINDRKKGIRVFYERRERDQYKRIDEKEVPSNLILTSKTEAIIKDTKANKLELKLYL